MDFTAHNKIVSFIWSIADDCLRDVYVRGKYRDVILPMFVLRRLDCLLEPSKDAVMEEVKFQQDDAGLADLEPEGLMEASGYVFYNTSPWTLKRLVDTATNNRQILEANFKAYLDGFSENVKEIVDKFKLRAQIRHMAEKDVLLEVLDKFISPLINLTPFEAQDPDGRKLPPLTNLGMGYVFEELIRKFNEENNEEAGEHFTPREVIDLMTHILFMPVHDQLPPVITIYDPACGSGGMLTESQDFITNPEGQIQAKSDVYLYGKEINDETYAICKSDMMIKGNNPEHIKCGSTLASDDFAGMRFDFMLSNPPYGKSWAGDQKHILDGKQVLDHRFEVTLANYRGELETVPATPRSSDGQLLFLMEMVNKMKDLGKGPAGSRIASVHNGSSLFTGDAGGGESNIRRHIIENDLLEAIIQLPNNLFYNTGITTYIWVLSNKKAEPRRGKVQLIDASQKFQKLRKNLGAKNCEFSPEHIREITQLYLDMPDSGCSKLFENSDFGYYKITIERPSRRAAQFTPERIATLRFVPALRDVMEWAYERWGGDIYTRLMEHRKAIEAHLEKEEINLSAKQNKVLLDPATWTSQKTLLQVAEVIMAEVGHELFLDFNQFAEQVDNALKLHQVRLTASERNQLFNAVSWYDEQAEKVMKKTHRLSGKKLEDLLTELDCTKEQLADFGYWPTESKGEYVEFESESDLRDTENVPLKDDIHGYFLREVRPHADDAWINIGQTKTGYEISFNKYFYNHKTLQTIQSVTQDIQSLETEVENTLERFVSVAQFLTKGLDKKVPMRDSGVDWIGEVPSHWRLKRAKWLFKNVKRPISPNDDVITCFRDGQVTLRTNRRTEGFTNAIQEHGYQGVKKGDLVIHAMDAFAGAIGVSDSDGKSSPVYSVCVPINENEVFPEYYALFVRQLALNGYIQSLAKGIRERSTDFRYKDFAILILPVPPYGEQVQIVSCVNKINESIVPIVENLKNIISKAEECKRVICAYASIGKIKI